MPDPLAVVVLAEAFERVLQASERIGGRRSPQLLSPQGC